MAQQKDYKVLVVQKVQGPWFCLLQKHWVGHFWPQVFPWCVWEFQQTNLQKFKCPLWRGVQSRKGGGISRKEGVEALNCLKHKYRHTLATTWKKSHCLYKWSLTYIFNSYADSHCTIENYLVIVHVQNFPVKFQFSELFFVLLMKFILLLLPEHLSRRLFTLPLAAPIWALCDTIRLWLSPGDQCHK